jgi:SsrA-binding protein
MFSTRSNICLSERSIKTDFSTLATRIASRILYHGNLLESRKQRATWRFSHREANWNSAAPLFLQNYNIADCVAMSLITNKKAFHDYFIEEKFEAGLSLEGWEVKAIRSGRANIKESYVIIHNGEMFLFGMHITPLLEASTHVKPDPLRTRKLLLHAKEISRLIGRVERAGYTLIPLDLHFQRGRIKAEIGLAKGKKQYDKREAEKERDWDREKARILRQRAS